MGDIILLIFLLLMISISLTITIYQRFNSFIYKMPYVIKDEWYNYGLYTRDPIFNIFDEKHKYINPHDAMKKGTLFKCNIKHTNKKGYYKIIDVYTKNGRGSDYLYSTDAYYVDLKFVKPVKQQNI